MTFEKLLGLPPEGLEALSDQQLEEYLRPYLATTRAPEQVKTFEKEEPVAKPKKPKKVKKTTEEPVTKTPEQLRAEILAL